MSRAEITTPKVLSDESVVELSLRPQRLAEFIGQQKVKDSLRIYIDAALARRRTARSHAVLRPAGTRQDDARRADRARARRQHPHELGAGAREAGRSRRRRSPICAKATSSSSTRSIA